MENQQPLTPLGMYLLDITYIDSAYPASDSIIETQQRANQMNNLLRTISDLQVSCSYDHLVTLSHVQKCLMSVHYIEELQKFVEDDNYKLSLKIEPGTSLASSKEELGGPSELSLTLRYSRRPTCPDTSVCSHLPTPPPSRHRKSHSLGNNMMCMFSLAESKSATFPIEKQRHLLDDSFLECHSPSWNPPRSSVFTNGLSLGSIQSSASEDLSGGMVERSRLYATLGPNWKVSPRRNSPRSSSYLCSPPGVSPPEGGNELGGTTMEGPLRRKTVLKGGRKPTLSSWTRFWIILSGATLTFYGSKSLMASERKHYKSAPCKRVSLAGWMVVLPDDPRKPGIFQLNDPEKGNVYKFQTGSRFSAIIWHRSLDLACRSCRPQTPANLMSFE
ncbi:hypothetical protein AGOR_G00249890 [Albula goreensis]|uniref:PH domain-containing protein n=1 Tax=Albula goreensis TaxID=1534307 RepID=A0A8T3CEA7_9TELE|nr:hypothetical protein AGOR_G00249890 [Albula goreensis]